MEKIRVGFIGLGCRGYDLLFHCVLPHNVEVAAVCDIYQDRVDTAIKLVQDKHGNTPNGYTNYLKVLEDENVNTIIIATAWESHIEIAIAAMRAGKAVAMEVGGAYSVEQCWELVNTYEETGSPFMLMENCCFSRREMMVLNMARLNLFGEIVHCSGGYHHDIRDEITYGKDKRHYRLRNYLNRNCDNYPTHELGPIAKILNINHGNRMLSLTSTASKSAGLHSYIEEHKSDDKYLMDAKFNQGDIITTVIKCYGGETITLSLDTTLPAIPNREITVRGTKGLYMQMLDSVLLDSPDYHEKAETWQKDQYGNAEEYAKDYEHPVWKDYLENGVDEKVGHGGMDWLEFKIFFDCLKNDKPMPVDVYDAASWMAISALSEKSIIMGSYPVEIPDFTRGKWLIPKNEKGFWDSNYFA